MLCVVVADNHCHTMWSLY